MWGTITNLFSSPPADETEDTNHDRADEESFEIEQAEIIMERPLQRRLSAANLLSSNGQSEEAYDPRQVNTPRCFAKKFTHRPVAIGNDPNWEGSSLWSLPG
jgi:hypothetical protein